MVELFYTLCPALKWLKDGTIFESSRQRDKPYTFVLGTVQAVKGWNKGLLGMCEGEIRKLVIPSSMGYGPKGVAPLIPGNATLYWEVELLKIEREPEL
ncbi:unnamed protein product [Soboliphyme baturini]|uniref:peptidylprolyl isomerase n=1 Tax=Soboliphyme baturini TaxID=241478 RepID=A0A183IR27_9BILA|nr:unnamed protein product [Soboliphyme baturini]